MDVDLVTRNWALWAAAIPLAIALWLIGSLLYRRSSSGQLKAKVRDHRRAVSEVRSAEKAVAQASARVSKLEQNAVRVKPRVLDESRGLLDDARALAKIAADNVLITANHVRRIIHEEFPPSRQEEL